MTPARTVSVPPIHHPTAVLDLLPLPEARRNVHFPETPGDADRARRRLAYEELFVIQNNHFRGQALVNALQMKRLLQNGPPLAPEELVLAYPQLEGAVTVRRSRLF